MSVAPLKLAVALVPLSLAWSVALHAHHSASMFETREAVVIAGTIVRFEAANPHSYLYLERPAEDGRIERWAVEGPPQSAHARRRIRPEVLAAGATVEACGYALKAGAPDPRAVDGRLLLAELVFTADGEGHLWTDYGNHRCRDRYRGDPRLR